MTHSLAARTLGAPGSRRRRVSVLVGVPLLALSLVAAAWAVFFGRAGVEGSGRVATFSASWAGSGTSAAPVVDDSTTATPKTAPAIETGTLVLPSGLEFFPGQTYTFAANVAVKSDSSRPGYVSGLDFSGLGAGFEARIVSGCGAFLKPYAVSSDVATVKVEIRATDAAASGASWSLAPEAAVLLTPLPASATTAPANVTCDKFTGAAAA